MNRLKLACRKLNLQVRQVAELYKFRDTNYTRYIEQKRVLKKLMNPTVLLTDKDIAVANCQYAKYLNGLTRLAQNEAVYKLQIKAFKNS